MEAGDHILSTRKTRGILRRGVYGRAGIEICGESRTGRKISDGKRKYSIHIVAEVVNMSPVLHVTYVELCVASLVVEQVYMAYLSSLLDASP